jgi:hypothetical protein
MSCCSRPIGLPNINELTQLILVKPYKSIDFNSDLQVLPISLKILLLDCGYAKTKN